MKPMLKYRGGKQREIAEIKPFIPEDFDRYVEPFLGGGALFFHLDPPRALVNDLNRGLMNFYRGVRDNFETLSSELRYLSEEYEENRKAFEKLKAAHPEETVPDANEARYYEMRAMFNGAEESPWSWAALYYYINKTAYSGMIRYNKRGEYNVPYGRYRHLPVDSVTRQHADALARAEVTDGDFQQVLNACTPKDFVFLDPPYDCAFSDYGNPELRGSFSISEHERLAESFFSLPCPGLMVIGRTDLTDRLYGAHIVHEYKKSYAVNIRNRFKSESTHILVSNGK